MPGYRHLSLADRTTIEKMGQEGCSFRQIARRLGRSPSTVAREVRRGVFSADAVGTAYKPYRDPRLRSACTVSDPVYVASWAQRRSDQRRAWSHQPRKMRSDRLVAYVCDRLRAGWTPQLVCGRARRDHPGDKEMAVCAETVYAWIYSPSQAHRRLMDYLPRAHRARRSRPGRRVARSSPPGRTPISERPPAADQRTQFGHWEGDTIVGATTGHAVRTEVERKTRYLAARKVAGTTSASALDAQTDVFASLPPAARLSTTCDNGPEHAQHAALAARLGTTTYFARPYHSWERGTNERTNGLLRRYFPKRTDFATVTDDDLQACVTEINHRPMAVLDYRTPAEAFHAELDRLASLPSPSQECCTSG